TVAGIEVAADPVPRRGAWIAFAVAQGINHPVPAGADEQGSLIAQGERTGIGHVIGIDVDAEAWRELDRVQRQVAAGADPRHQGGEQAHGQDVCNAHADPLCSRYWSGTAGWRSPACTGMNNVIDVWACRIGYHRQVQT